MVKKAKKHQLVVLENRYDISEFFMKLLGSKWKAYSLELFEVAVRLEKRFEKGDIPVEERQFYSARALFSEVKRAFITKDDKIRKSNKLKSLLRAVAESKINLKNGEIVHDSKEVSDELLYWLDRFPLSDIFGVMKFYYVDKLIGQMDSEENKILLKLDYKKFLKNNIDPDLTNLPEASILLNIKKYILRDRRLKLRKFYKKDGIYE